jgi:predicted nucleic acid-binding protein
MNNYSVLTRLPPPHRTAGAVVRDLLEARFPEPFLRLDARAYKRFVAGLTDHGATGGAAYDVSVAATATGCDAELVTCDRRALPIYERYGVRTQLLS